MGSTNVDSQGGQQGRRKLVRMTGNLIVSLEESQEKHRDPRLRGGYLIYEPPQGGKQRVPEIVLDGLAEPGEREAAEQRCLQELEAMRAVHEEPKREAPPVGRGAAATERAAVTLLGQRLVAQGLLRPEQLRAALERQKSLPESEKVRRLGSLLIQAGVLTTRQVAEALGQQRGVAPTSGGTSRVDPTVRGLFPVEVLSRVGAAPLCVVGKTVAVAMVDPHRKEDVAELQRLTTHQVRPMQAPQLQVHGLLESLQDRTGAAASAVSSQRSAPGSAVSSQRSAPGSAASQRSGPPAGRKVAGSGQSASGSEQSFSRYVPAPRSASETPRAAAETPVPWTGARKRER